jgi:hypothetical protein
VKGEDMKANAPLIFLPLALALILAGCPNPTSYRTKEERRTGSFQVRVGAPSGSAQMTIVPPVVGSVTSIVVTATSGPTVLEKAIPGPSGSVDFKGLVIGSSWTLSATAYAGGTAVGSGSGAAPVTVGSGMTTVPLAIAYTESGPRGTLDITVSWPDSSHVDYLRWDLSSGASGEEDFSSTPPTGANWSANIIANDLSPGKHILTLAFRKDGAPVGTFVEAVNIIGGHTSSRWIDGLGHPQDGPLTIDPNLFSNTNPEASLAGLAIASSSNYSFSPGTTAYSNIRLAVNALSFTPTQGMPGQIIRYSWNGTERGIVPSGTAMTETQFQEGLNTLAVAVTAPDGVTTKSYTVTLNAYRIVYDANGGTGTTPAPSNPAPSGSSTTLVGGGDLQRGVNGCNGWYTAPSVPGGTYYAGGWNCPIDSSNIVLYAMYGNASLAGINTSDPYWTLTGMWTIEDWHVLDGLLRSITIPIHLDMASISLANPNWIPIRFDEPQLESIILPPNLWSISQVNFSGCTNLHDVLIIGSTNRIEMEAFRGCDHLFHVSIPSSVTSIGDLAFQGCSSLTSIDIPSGVTSIGNAAFQGCSSLTWTNIPDSVTSIGDLTFQGCSSLTNINIPSSVTSIGNAAFQGCGLNIIDIPTLVTTIGAFAFQGCSNLTSIRFPIMLSAIPPGVCQDCVNLNNVMISSPINGIGDSAFENCSNLSNINISDVQGTIGANAFANSGLTSITIPSDITSIDYRAFYNCRDLSTVHERSFAPPGLGPEAFDNEAAGRIIYVPILMLSLYSTMPVWSDYYIQGVLQEE